MRRVNFRFVGLASITLLLVGTAVRFWHDRQVGRISDDLLVLAKTFESQERFSESAAYFTRYQKLVPQDMDAMARLGSTLTRVPGGEEQALVVLESVLLHEPDRSDCRRELVRSALAIGRFTDAQLHLARLLPTAPQDPELLALFGQCQMGQGDYAKAEATLRAALLAAPDRIEVYDRLSRLLQDQLSRPAQAAELLDEMVAVNQQSAAAYVMRSRYRRRAGALPAARQDMDQALALAADDANTLLAAAELAQAQGQMDQAREYLAHGLDACPLNSAMYLAAIRLELQSPDLRAALTQADRALDRLPNHPELLWNKADLLVEIGDEERATLIIEQLQRAAYPAAPLGYLKGRVLFHRRQWMAAAQQFATAREGGALAPDLARQADHWSGRCHEMLGNLDLALAAYRQVVALAPQWLPGRQSLAGTLAALGRYNEAIENYREITRLSDAPPAVRLTLVRSLILRNLAAQEGSRDWGEVETALDEARRFSNEAVQIAILQAEMLLARGRSSDAAQALAEARNANPQSAEAWAALVALAVRQAEWESAAELLAAAETLCGDRVGLRLARGQLLAEANSSTAGRTLLDLEEDRGGFSMDEQLRLLRELGVLHFSMGRMIDAARLWSVVAQHQPQEISVRLFLLDAARHGDNQTAIERVLEEIGRIEGASHGVLGRYAQAVQIVAEARRGPTPSLALARGLLNEAMVRRPAWSRIPLLVAEVDELEGNPSSAIEHSRQAIDLGDSTPGLLRHTIELLYRENRFVEADQILRAFNEQSVPFSAELRSVAAEASLRVQDHSRTADLAQRAAANSERFEDYIWLGQLLTRLRRDDQAEVAYRKAIDLAVSADSPWVAFARFLLLTGQTQRIESVLAEAAARIPAANRSSTLARCYEAVEQPVKAERQYKLAWQDAAADPNALVQVAGFYLRTGQLAEADPLLRKLLKSTAGDSRTVAWARRSLAMILAAAGDFKRFQQALELIDRNLKMPDSTDEDRRDKAHVLATRSGVRWRREALEILTGLQRRATGSSDDRLLLAELYRADGQWPRARREMQILLAGPATPRLIAGYLEGLLETGELQEAGHWIRRLEQVEPETQRTLRLRVRMSVMEGKTADAIQIMDSYVRESGDPAIRSERLGWAAHLFEETCSQIKIAPAAKDLLAAKAEAAYRDWVATDPAAGLKLGQFLARRGQIVAALELLEQTAENADPKEISATADILAGSHQLTLPQLARISSALDRASERQRAAVLYVSQANLASLAGDYQRAEALYGRALEIEPRQIDALNKLALVRSLADGQHAEALRLVEQAMEIVGPEAELLDSRATVELAAGQLRAAQDDLKDALDDRRLASAYFHLAQLLAAQGNAKSAKVALEQGQELGLSLHGLHPLEQRTYQQLTNELKGWSALRESK